jgi:hypothetical protein
MAMREINKILTTFGSRAEAGPWNAAIRLLSQSIPSK